VEVGIVESNRQLSERSEDVRMVTEIRIMLTMVAFGRIVEDVLLTSKVRMRGVLFLD